MPPYSFKVLFNVVNVYTIVSCTRVHVYTRASLLFTKLITLRVRRSRGEMYSGHGRLCVCLSLAACLHECTAADVSWGNGTGCPLVVHCWGICNRCTGFVAMTTAPNAKCQRVLKLVLALCLVIVALCNRADHYIFMLWFVLLLLLLSFFFSSPNLSSRRLDVYHTSAHGVVLV